jgi:hypothetical protein
MGLVTSNDGAPAIGWEVGGDGGRWIGGGKGEGVRIRFQLIWSCCGGFVSEKLEILSCF